MCTVSQTHLLLLLRSLRSLLPVASLLLLRHHPTTAQSSHSPRPSYHCAIRTPYQHHPFMPRHSIASKHHFHSLTQSTATSGRRRQGPIPCPCTTRKTHVSRSALSHSESALAGHDYQLLGDWVARLCDAGHGDGKKGRFYRPWTPAIAEGLARGED